MCDLSRQDPGVGANETLIAEAKNNSAGYDMFHDGRAADVFVKDANGSILLAEVRVPCLSSSTPHSSFCLSVCFISLVKFYQNFRINFYPFTLQGKKTLF